MAMALAEEGGFDNVRQRDVAANAGVALGTLYKRFRSKEAILCAAIEREAEALEQRMETSPAAGRNFHQPNRFVLSDDNDGNAPQAALCARGNPRDGVGQRKGSANTALEVCCAC